MQSLESGRLHYYTTKTYKGQRSISGQQQSTSLSWIWNTLNPHMMSSKILRMTPHQGYSDSKQMGIAWNCMILCILHAFYNKVWRGSEVSMAVLLQQPLWDTLQQQSPAFNSCDGYKALSIRLKPVLTATFLHRASAFPVQAGINVSVLKTKRSTQKRNDVLPKHVIPNACVG